LRLLALALSAALLAASPSPSPAPAKLFFPRIEARSLSGDDFVLPRDFAGKPTLVIVTFKKDQTDQAKSWSAVVCDFERKYDRLRGYDIALIDPHARLFRGFIENGMRSAITDTAVRAIFLTALVDARGFREALGLEGTDAAVELLVRSDGAVLWHALGGRTDEAVQHLRDALDRTASE
jgi:hypothetical protein